MCFPELSMTVDDSKRSKITSLSIDFVWLCQLSRYCRFSSRDYLSRLHQFLFRLHDFLFFSISTIFHFSLSRISRDFRSSFNMTKFRFFAEEDHAQDRIWKTNRAETRSFLSSFQDEIWDLSSYLNCRHENATFLRSLGGNCHEHFMKSWKKFISWGTFPLRWNRHVFSRDVFSFCLL